jgi:hypothetical protein
MPPVSILDRVLQLTSAGIDVRTALNYAVADVSKEVGQRVGTGQSVGTALESTGFTAASAKKLISLLSASAFAEAVSVAVGVPAIVDAVATAIRVVVGGGGVAGIPTAECLAKHLPPDREPTREEFEEAWKACRNQ